MKNKMSKAEEIKEVAMVSAIIADCITKPLYDEMQKQGHGYIDTIDTISQWAIEFVKTHKKTSWEDVLETGITPLSKEIKDIICYDDAVFDFAHYKLELMMK